MNKVLFRSKKDPDKTFLVYEEDFRGKLLGVNSDGISKSYTTQYLNKNFEPEIPDYSKFGDQLLRLAQEDPVLLQSLQQICRRLHPGGYFHKGDKVFAVKKYPFFETKDRDIQDLINWPLEIVDFIDSKTSTVRLMILNPLYRTDNSIVYRIPIYLDGYYEVDAFACLRRYNMPY